MKKLDSVQCSAALTVKGVWRGTSLERLYEELGCISNKGIYANVMSLYEKALKKSGSNESFELQVTSRNQVVIQRIRHIQQI